MLTQDGLRARLAYDPETGLFTRLRTGKIACARTTSGYVRIKIDKVEYLAHRLAWLYAHGRWPAREIDHINGVRDDNREVNLREADPRQQRANAKLNADNTSGYRGVYFNKRRQKWRAHIQHEHLGYFDNKEDAATSYAAAFDLRFGPEFRRAA